MLPQTEAPHSEALETMPPATGSRAKGLRDKQGDFIIVLMRVRYTEIGVCGLSCRLCPRYHTETKSKCFGCKSESRMAVGCPFITCAIKHKGVEFCWDCDEYSRCEKWAKRRTFGRRHDSFKCYQRLEEDIAFIQKHRVVAFEKQQKARETILTEMLREFNEGRSKSFYCIAATVMTVDELQEAIARARAESQGLPITAKSKVFHALLDAIGKRRKYCLKLRG